MIPGLNPGYYLPMLREVGRLTEKYKYNTPSFTYVVNGVEFDKRSRFIAMDMTIRGHIVNGAKLDKKSRFAA